MILVDANYLIALLRPSDELHRRAAAWSRYVRQPLLISEPVLFEAVNALSARHLRHGCVQLLQQVKSGDVASYVRVNSRLFDTAARLYGDRGDKSWSLTDCVSFVIMRERGIADALTHDHHFEQAGFRALLREDPPTNEVGR